MDIIENIEPKWEIEWDYLGWKKHWKNAKDLDDPQKDWNQTMVTKINQISTQIHMASCSYDEKTKITTELGSADTIMTNKHCLSIIKSSEYFNKSEMKLGKRYTAIANDLINENIVYVFRKDVPDDYEKKENTIGVVKILNY